MSVWFYHENKINKNTENHQIVNEITKISLNEGWDATSLETILIWLEFVMTSVDITSKFETGEGKATRPCSCSCRPPSLFPVCCTAVRALSSPHTTGNYWGRSSGEQRLLTCTGGKKERNDRPKRSNKKEEQIRMRGGPKDPTKKSCAKIYWAPASKKDRCIKGWIMLRFESKARFMVSNWNWLGWRTQ